MANKGGGGDSDEMMKIWYPVNRAVLWDWIFLLKQGCLSVNMLAKDSLSPEKKR